MSEPTVAPTGPAGEPSGYRPISVLAIIGLSLSALFAALVLLSVAASLVSGGNVFLANWLLALPLAGGVLSVLAGRRIRGSEGTLAGEALTTWGLWLAVLVGFGYVAYYQATGYAIQLQADRFLMEQGADGGFFPSLVEGDLNRAFLLTQPYNQRGDTNPGDVKAMQARYDRPSPMSAYGPLSEFRQHEVPQLIAQADGAAEVTSQGVKNWVYEKGGYVVVRNYEVATPQAVVNLAVTTRSNDNDAPGEARKWHVVWPAQVTALRFSPAGEAVQQLRQSARAYMDEWRYKLRTAGAPVPQDRTDWAQVNAPAGQKEKLKAEWEAYFAGTDKEPRNFELDRGEFPAVRKAGAHAEVTSGFQAPALRSSDPRLPPLVVDGTFTVRSKTPVEIGRPAGPVEWEPAGYQLLRLIQMPKDDMK